MADLAAAGVVAVDAGGEAPAVEARAVHVPHGAVTLARCDQRVAWTRRLEAVPTL